VDQMAFLQARGYSFGQGYFFSRQVSGAEFERRLRAGALGMNLPLGRDARWRAVG